MLAEHYKMKKFIFLLLSNTFSASLSSSPWTWECQDDVCTKTKLENEQKQTSLIECTLTCSPTIVLWPLPANVELGKSIFTLEKDGIQVESNVLQQKVEDAVQRQKDLLGMPAAPNEDYLPLKIDVTIVDENLGLTSSTLEDYTLIVTNSGQEVQAKYVNQTMIS